MKSCGRVDNAETKQILQLHWSIIALLHINIICGARKPFDNIRLILIPIINIKFGKASYLVDEVANRCNILMWTVPPNSMLN